MRMLFHFKLATVCVLSAMLMFATRLDAKRPEIDAVYWGQLTNDGGQAVVPSLSNQIFVVAKSFPDGVIVAESVVAPGQSIYVLKIPLDDGGDPRVPGTMRGGENIRLFLKNAQSSLEFEATQTRSAPISLSAQRGEVQTLSLSIPENLGASPGALAAFSTWKRSRSVLAFTSIDTNQDSDGDGVKNFDEYLADTDPEKAGDRLRILEVKRLNGVASVRFGPVRPSRKYTLFSIEPGSTTGWQQVRTATPTSAADYLWLDHVTGSVTNLIYRVSVEVQ